MTDEMMTPERLAEIKARAKQHRPGTDYAEHVPALIAEVERLRAALERIANAPPSPHPHHSTNVVMRSVTVDVARAALSAYDAAPRYGVEEIANRLMQIGISEPVALGAAHWLSDNYVFASNVVGPVSPDDRARIRNEALEEAAEALIAASEGEPERWVSVSDEMGRHIGARLEGRTQKLLRGMQAATIVRSLKTKD